MQSDRSSLREILREIKQEVRDDAKQKLNDPGQIMRVFDGFPPLISMDLLAYFLLSFQNILQRIPLSSIAQNDDGLYLEDEHVRNAIIAFMKTIIHMAQRELLNENNNIKEDVCAWLQWPPISSSQVVSIICAYVGKMNQDIMYKMNKEAMGRPVKEIDIILPAVFNYMNNNYKAWVEEELKVTPKATHIPASVLIGGGASILAVAGVAFYCAKKSHTRPSDEPLSPTRKIQF